jgi:hypothetical protein
MAVVAKAADFFFFSLCFCTLMRSLRALSNIDWELKLSVIPFFAVGSTFDMNRNT